MALSPLLAEQLALTTDQGILVREAIPSFRIGEDRFITDDQLEALLEEQQQHPGQLLGKVAEAHERGVQLDVATLGSGSVAGVAVQDLVTILGNLLDNAMRHTPPEGEVVVSARAERDQVIISVLDSGEGVGPEHLPHLGERFYRADAGRERGRGGVGLGLAICRAILQAHQGSMEIRSSLEQGTEVAVTLPAVNEAESG